MLMKKPRCHILMHVHCFESVLHGEICASFRCVIELSKCWACDAENFESYILQVPPEIYFLHANIFQRALHSDALLFPSDEHDCFCRFFYLGNFTEKKLIGNDVDGGQTGLTKICIIRYTSKLLIIMWRPCRINFQLTTA